MSRTTAGLPKTDNSPSSGPQGQEGGFFYEREEVRQVVLTWLLAATMVLTLLPVSMLAADAPDEAAEDGEAVLTPVAGVEEEEAAPVEAVPMLLATPAAADTPIAVPTDKLFLIKLTA